MINSGAIKQGIKMIYTYFSVSTTNNPIVKSIYSGGGIGYEPSLQ